MINHKTNFQHQGGFTLIELMVVVAIVAILAAVSYPSYQEYLKDSRRAEAKTSLVAFSGAMERHKTQTNTYLGAAQSGDTGAPAVFETTAPLGSSLAYYNLTIEAATASTYTLRATPIGPQLGNGYLEINSLDQKAWDENDSDSIEGSEFDWEKD